MLIITSIILFLSWIFVFIFSWWIANEFFYFKKFLTSNFDSSQCSQTTYEYKMWMNDGGEQE